MYPTHIPDSIISRDVQRIYQRRIDLSRRERQRLADASIDSLRSVDTRGIKRCWGFKIVDIYTFYRRIYKMRKIEFVVIRLSKADKKPFEAYAKEVFEDWETHLLDLVGQGYKIGLSYDPSAKCYISSVTGTEEALDNKNSCFTSRAPDGVEAIMLSLYKHYQLANSGDWSKIQTSQDNWG